MELALERGLAVPSVAAQNRATRGGSRRLPLRHFRWVGFAMTQIRGILSPRQELVSMTFSPSITITTLTWNAITTGVESLIIQQIVKTPSPNGRILVACQDRPVFSLANSSTSCFCLFCTDRKGLQLRRVMFVMRMMIQPLYLDQEGAKSIARKAADKMEHGLLSDKMASMVMWLRYQTAVAAPS